uniref:Lymphoid enhancer-binding factor 1 n=1 Tax=Paramormyrops kingsleyae TaxID=1676925 RepID=A0A3B3SQM1_9TELE
MPQLAGGGDPELCATDEMIPFKDEGDPQKEQIFAEISHSEEEGDLADIKSSLVNESETSPNSNSHDVSILMPCVACKGGVCAPFPSKGHAHTGGVMKGLVSGGGRMIRMSNKVPVVQPSHAVHPLTPLITYSDEHFAPGPHSGHHPQDVNSKQGMPRHHPGPDIPNFYPLSPGGVGQITPPLGWFSHHMVPGPPGPHATGIPHPAIVNPQVKHEPQHDGDLMHIGFPPLPPHPNLPRTEQWHALSREEQAKYYELARKERQLHMQLYPGWSARDNYVSMSRTVQSSAGTGQRMKTAYI